MLQLDGVDDLTHDDDVTLTLRVGQGLPLLGTDGELLSGQTFDVSPESEDVVAERAWIEDGVLHAAPFLLHLQIEVFGVRYVVALHHAHLRAALTFDGGLADGYLGGAIPTAELLAVALTADSRVGGDPFAAFFGPVLTRNADLEPGADGKCTMLSGTFRFSAVSAFLFAE